ncbi:DUF2975 domain-containing protein [Haloplasma contractile]|uniref:DUF2975 domain-containing protein n=1 Tax=Haloplasma contractile SSD-17B TaxID=1033810 RepID=U2EB98_9MOLU|nr:DUF2975 domain-containing protein [Haloplasma contractile]ERJ12061.1 hypothetical protein HLPCO_001975 [Haloplasma contractile SSD-17B]
MGKEFSTEQFKKLISFAAGLTKVMFFGTIIFGSLFIMAGIVVLILDRDWFTVTEAMMGSLTFDFNSAVEINASELIDQDINLKSVVLATCFSIPVIFGLVAVILHYLSRILSSLKDNTPFTNENVKSLKVIAWSIIISSVLVPAVETFIFTMIIHSTGIEQLDSVFSIDLTALFVGFLLLILSHIFNYGTYLQKEYDQTL